MKEKEQPLFIVVFMEISKFRKGICRGENLPAENHLRNPSRELRLMPFRTHVQVREISRRHKTGQILPEGQAALQENLQELAEKTGRRTANNN